MLVFSAPSAPLRERILIAARPRFASLCLFVAIPIVAGNVFACKLLEYGAEEPRKTFGEADAKGAALPGGEVH